MQDHRATIWSLLPSHVCRFLLVPVYYDLRLTFRTGSAPLVSSEVEFIRPNPSAAYLTVRLAFTGKWADIDHWMATYPDSPPHELKPWGKARADMTLAKTLQAGLDDLQRKHSGEFSRILFLTPVKRSS